MVNVLRDLNGDVVEYALVPVDVTGFNEAAQDAVGGILLDSGRIDFTYDDAAGSITADLIAGSVANSYLANMGQGLFKMRAAGAGTGAPIDGTAAQAKTALAIVPADVAGFDTQVRTSRLDQMATPTASVGMGSQKLTSLADGTVSTDGVNLGQLTAAIEGRKNKDPVAVATTANITLSGEQTIDGYLTAGSRVLVKNQSTAANNGIYVSGAGAWTRAVDANTAAEISNASVLIQNGTVGKGDVFTSNAITTLGTDAITWAQTGEGNTIYTADGSTIQLVGTQFSIPNSGVGTNQIGANQVTNAKLAQMAQATFKMRAAAAGTGDPIDGTVAQAKTALAYTAADVANVPAGSIAATNVQTALNELDTEKVPLSANSFTNAVQARASSSLSLTTTITDVPGASVTITTQVANTVVMVMAAMDVECFNTTTGDIAVGYLNVDGTDVTSHNAIVQGQTPAATTRVRVTGAQVWLVTLAAAGSHTIKLRGSKTANTAGSLSVQLTHTSLTVMGRFT